MKAHCLILAAAFLGGTFLLTGCQKDSAVTPDGKTLVYKMDGTDPTGPDTTAVTPRTASVKAPADQKALAKFYDEREARKAAAKTKAARRTPPKPAAPKPLASDADMKAARELVSSLNGSIQTGPGGAIIGLTLAASASSQDGDAAASVDEGEEGKAAPPAANLTPDDMALVGRLADLESISFEGNAFTDETCAPLANLKKLNKVTINNANIQDATLEMLATLPELAFLDIRRDLKLNNASLEILQKMSKLTTLHAHYNSFTNSGMNKIAKVATLKVVDVRGCPDVSDNGAKYLAKLPELEELYFRFMITNAGVEHLTAAPKLKFIEFQDCNDINDGAVESFLKIPALTGLRIFRCKGFNDAALAGIAKRPLERLELRDLNISNDGIAALKDQTALKTIEMSELASVDAAGLTDLLSALKGIEKIAFFTIELNDEGLTNLVENNPEMKELAARAVNITDAGIDQILKLKNLSALDLRSNSGISADALLKLKEMTNLKRLYLKETSIVAKGNEEKIAELKAALPKTRIIE